MYPKKSMRELNLLLIDEHYVLIDDFNRFIFGITKNKDRKFFCMYCLHHYHTKEALNNHKEVCMVINGVQAVKMPSEKEKWMKFRNYKRQLMAPFVIYADFESIVEKVGNPKGLRTQEYQKHKVCGYGLKVVCCYDDNCSKPVETYRGGDATYKFIERVIEIEKKIRDDRGRYFNKLLVMSEEDKKALGKQLTAIFVGRSLRKMIE